MNTGRKGSFFLMLFSFLIPSSLFSVTFGPHLQELLSTSAPSMAPSEEKKRYPLELLVWGKEVDLYLDRIGTLGIPAVRRLGVGRVTVPLERIRDLQGEEDVVVDLGARFFPLLDISVPAMGVTPFIRAKKEGKGVLVAILDTGIDLKHPDFLNADGSTRFVAYWDQTFPSTSKDSYGLFCDSVSIDEGECSSDPEAPIDTIVPRGHGTHVAGIVGSSHFRYRGVAPQAFLVGVRMRFSEPYLIDALDWVRSLADRWKLPVVVNLSLGSNEGPHDGSFPSEIAIDTFSGPGRVVVSAAGNEGDRIHLRIPPGEYGGRFVSGVRGIPFSSTKNMELQLWSDKGNLWEFSIGVEKGGRGILDDSPFFPVPLSSTQGLLRDGGKELFSYTVHPIESSTATGADLKLEKREGTFSDFRFIVRVHNRGSSLVDIWITNRSGEFTEDSGEETLSTPRGMETISFLPGDKRFTITLPGTSRRVITVTGYLTRVEWNDLSGTVQRSTDPLGSLIPSASFGPTRDGREKPDISAPGGYIASSLSRSYSPPDSLKLDETHFLLRGTSMATPHITGVSALFLEGNPSLTPEEILNFFDRFRESRGKREEWGRGILSLSRWEEDPSFFSFVTDSTPPTLSSPSFQVVGRKISVTFFTSELTRGGLETEKGEKIFPQRFSERHRFWISNPRGEKIRIFAEDLYGNRTLSSFYDLPPTGCGCTVGGKGSSSISFFFLLLLYWFLRNGSRSYEARS